MNEDKLRDYLKWVTTDLHETRQKLKRLEQDAAEPVAIVAMSCRFPGGVVSPEGFWQLLEGGVDALTEFPADRGWEAVDAYDADPERAGTSYAKTGGFIEDAATFDAEFFGISPREALGMDPQQRLLLETAWELFERAGLDPAALRGSSTGVFIGSNGQDYSNLFALSSDDVGGYLATGAAASVVSGRISYTFGFEGPAVTVDTACSSSLVAVHLAAQSLRRGECDLAVVGGATVMSSPALFVEFSRQRGLSADGRCKAFADSADGTGWGEGVGLLLVERLSDARARGHQILAVVRGSAVNQDGASNGLTAPNGPSQQRVIRAALTSAGLTASEVDVVEAHGTGTSLGDPIEAQALLATYGKQRPEDRPLRLGSVKSNIGHTQAAAGVAGIIKMVEAMRHDLLPKSLHIDTPSTRVDWSSGAIELLAEAQPWPLRDAPRRAGVSSFGISGTNAHVILEEPWTVEAEGEQASGAAPQGTDSTSASDSDANAGGTTEAPADEATLPWILSARSAAALRAQAAQLHTFATERPGTAENEIGRALAATRAGHAHRAVVLGTDRAELLDGLATLAADDRDPAESAAEFVVTGTAAPGSGSTVFVFPGQGSQWAGMALGLLDSSPVFRARIEECEQALAPYVDWSLTGVLRAAPGAPTLERVDVVQPVLFAVMVSLAAEWQSYGVRPAAVVGHSQGEIAAACVAGLLSLPDAARVVALRSQALRELAGRGGMVSLALGEDRAAELIEDWSDRISVATLNGPGSTVVSGDPEALDELLAACAEQEVRARRIDVDYASHCAHVEAIRERLFELLSGLTAQPDAAAVPFYSTVDERYLDSAAVATADYWYRNLRQTVRFEPVVRALAEAGTAAFVEISAHPVLTIGVQQTLDSIGADAVVVGSLRRDEGGPARLRAGLAELYVHGLTVDWTARIGRPGQVGSAAGLPTYPFQGRRYWPTLTAPRIVSAADPADAAFWDAVDQADGAALAESLQVDQAAVEPLLPALSSWRERRKGEAAVDSWLYTEHWKPVPAQRDTGAISGTLLLLVPTGVDAGADAAALAEALGGQGATVRRIEIDATTANRETFAAALSEASGEPTGAVLSLLALDERPRPGHEAVTAGAAATLLLAQALGETDPAATGRLWCLTCGAVSTGPADRLRNPAQAAVWGLGRVVGLEQPTRWGGLIDLPQDLDAERTATRILAVLRAARADGGEDQVAVRGPGVFARRLRRGTAAAAPNAVGGWQPRGTVLITGGTGALGARMAQWVAERGAERVVLAGRRGADAPGVAELIARLAELGTTAVAVACDVSDRASLAALLREIDAEGPALRAVIHAAGLPQATPLDRLDLDDFTTVCAAKAAGAAHLDELLADRELDAFLVFSSIAAAWGSGGQAAYAAANAYLDALSRNRRSRGLTAHSVQWGGWAETGMAARPEAGDALRSRGIRPMDPAVALLALERILAGDEPVRTVADMDWNRFAPLFTALRQSPLLSDLPEVRAAATAQADASEAGGATDEAAGTLRGELAALAPAARVKALVELVRTAAAAVLGHDGPRSVDPQRPFRELGFDSLTALDLRKRLGERTGLRLAATLVFDHPTAQAVARHLDAELFGASGAAAADAKQGASTTVTADEPIAIVGMSCRFPGGVATPEDLWQLVAGGVDALGGFPDGRGWRLDADTDAGFALVGGFLDGADRFDPAVFGMSPREALATDPQQRLLLEAAWELFERAGVDPTSLRGASAGVYIGSAPSGYASNLTDIPEAVGGQLLTGNSGSVISGRISYTFGLEGPAVTVDTACSSSLVALHLAVQALQRGECDMAVTGGATIMSTPAVFVEFSKQRGLAGDGRCKAFADAADGTGWGEGVGLLLIERLSDARARGHRVLAVVRSTAVNQDGASNGLTAPNGPAQQRVIRAALDVAGLGPADVDVVEAHGTGTALGDPIEAQALLATYGQGRDADRPLWLGSIKSNIGHTQAASGVAGIIKMVQAMQHGVLPESLHIDAPSAQVDWSAGAVELLTEARPWEQNGDRPRRAGVSSFGISGTNAHVILEQALDADGVDPDSAPATAPVRRPELPVVPWPVSARSASALAAQAARLAAHVAEAGLDATDVGHALVTTRAALEHRAVVLGADAAELIAGLEALAEGREAPGVVTGYAASGDGAAAWVFTGQGSQWAGMGRQLYEAFPQFAQVLDEVCAEFEGLLDFSVRDALLSGDATVDADQTGVAQPAIFAIEVALAGLLRSWGMAPDFLAGHSIGEFAAAYVAGVFSLPDACRLVAARGSLMQALPEGGAMYAVAADWEQVQTWAPDGLWLAAVNAPGSIVVSGERAAIEAVRTRAEAESIRGSLLRVSHAFHSGLMDPMLDEFRAVAESVAYQAPAIPVVSTVTGRPEPSLWSRPEYWVDQVRSTVGFADAITALRADGVGCFVEIGPDAALTSMIGRCIEREDTPAAEPVLALPVMRRDRDDQPAHLLRTLASLHVGGVGGPDWARLFTAEGDSAQAPAHRRPVALPTYAFQRRSYWLEDGPGAAADLTATGLASLDHPLLTAVLPLAGSEGALVFTGRASAREHPWLAHHVVDEVQKFPGVAFVEMVRSVGDEAGCPRIGELVFESSPVVPADGAALCLQLTVGAAEADGAREFAVYSRPEQDPAAPWTRHARGVLTAEAEGDAEPEAWPSAWPPAGAEPVSVDELYPAWAEAGYDYGSTLRGLRAAWRTDDEAFAEVELDESLRGEGFGLHPALLETSLHVLALGIVPGLTGSLLPFSWSGVSLYADGATTLRVRVTPTGRGSTLSIRLADAAGLPVADVKALSLRAVTAAAPAEPTGQPAAAATPAAVPAAAAEQAPAAPAPAAEKGRRRTAQAAPAAADARETLRRRLDGPAAAEQDRILIDLVCTRTATVLGHADGDGVEPAQPFKDLGVSSLTAVELRDGLNADTGLRLPATLVFDYPTPLAVVALLKTELFGDAADAAGQSSQAITGPARSANGSRSADEAEDPIVIVGMACRFPGGVTTPQEFWELVAAGGDAISPLPTNRGWPEDLYHPDPNHPGTHYNTGGGFLHDAGEFDPAFFGISPREALSMDPQHRILLEIAWEALESAGVDPVTLRGSRTGVFAGIAYQDYTSLVALSKEGAEGMLGSGSSASVLTGRIAYTLGLEGPAVTIDTACSSSLVALHWACQALRNGDCTLALAGGVTVMATPVSMIEYSRQRALAPDGRCKPYAEAADGASWAEGAGLLLVERLSDALANGHPVLAVVRGSAVNQDGASNGMTAPNGPAQQRVIRAALANAGLKSADVDAVEGHGTGTTLGDPIEAQALLATYGRDRGAAGPLRLGSVKSNIGHAQAAAGVAGIIKTVLALRHELLPKTLHIDAPSSHVDWTAGDVELLTEAQPWVRGDKPRRAGVSAFGVSGTNAHVIIEEYAQAAQTDKAAAGVVEGPQPSAVPWVLSARTADGVRAQAARLHSHVTDLTGAADGAAAEFSPAEIGRALVSARSTFEHRAVVVGADRDELLAGLDALANDRPSGAVVTGGVGRGRTAWVFTGQGSQWTGMGRRLYDAFPAFAAKLDEVCAQFEPLVDFALRDVILDPDSEIDADRTAVAQPAIFAMEVALAGLLSSLGVPVDCVAGHSIGEIAAAHVAGVFPLAEACRLVAARGRLMQELPEGGAMLAVGADWDLVGPWAGDRAWLAAVNAPGSVVVSGERASVEAVRVRCEAAGIRNSRLRVSHAFHSGLMDPMLEPFRAVADELEYYVPVISMVSTVTGQLESDLWCEPGYWVGQARSPVRFADAVAELRASGASRFVEIGPDAALTALIERCLDDVQGGSNNLIVPVQRRDRDGQPPQPAQLYRALAALHTRGAGPDWNRLLGAAADTGAERHRSVPLPTYAFRRQRFWPTIEAPAVETATVDGGSPADRAFWSAIEREDVTALAETLNVEGDTVSLSLSALVPALAAWRRRGREHSTIGGWTYRITWTPLASSRTSARPSLTGSWLLVTSKGADSTTSRAAARWLAEILSAAGAHVAPVELDVADGASTEERMRAALAAQTGPAGVISLLGLDERAHPRHPGISVGLALTTLLTQTLSTLEYQGARLWSATRGAVSVGRADAHGDPIQASVWGFGRTAALEFPAGWGGLIDLPERLDARTADRLIGVLADPEGEDQLAVRDSGVFARRLAHHAPSASQSPASGEDWRPAGTVLVTGGTGALGGHVARWLAARGVPRLVLASRRGPAAPGAAELAAELEALGAGSVLIAACDLADRDRIAEMIRRVEAGGDPIRAVFHAAGVPQSAVLPGMPLSDFESVYAAKASGALYLDELLGDGELDAFVTFSSIAAVWGSGGQAAYAAGNSLLDGLAERRHASGRPATSVAWGPWAGGGMSSTGEGTEEYLSRRGLQVMAPELALTALDRALRSGDPTLVVADVVWDRFAPGFTGSRPSPLLGDLPEVAALAVAEPEGGDPMRERLLPLGPAERLELLLGLVRGEAAATLGHASADAVEPERPFNELGFDSLTAVELRNKLNAATGLRLTATLLFDYPNARVLAEYLSTRLGGDAAAAAPASAPAGSGAGPAGADPANDPVVIVGMGCRFPGGVSSPAQFWQLIASGNDAVGAFPADRGWDLEGLFDPDPDRAGSSYVREGGFLYEAPQFDAGFFGISPREALAMDPQQRLLLETAWEAFEDANIDPTSLRGGRVGVFAGTNGQDYISVLAAASAMDEGFAGTGNTAAAMSGRISYVFGFEGPAATVDTACSSSLVALHMAVQALQRGECELALAGGVTVMSTPTSFAAFSRQRGLATDGRCKAFAEAADGTGWGEGVGLLLVERLSDARARGHRVLAVIRGSAVNQDGASNGLTAPNGPSQQRVIRAALASAGLSVTDVDVVEAHGTGTALGDPIEAQALLATYGQGRDADHPLWLGSVKSNIGHTQAASGVAGIIKMVQAMRHDTLPATLHVDAPSSQVDWTAGSVELLTESRPWLRNGSPRRAGISAFGISGTNAHVILEEPDEEAATTAPAPMPVVPWLISARSESGLQAQAARLAAGLGVAEAAEPIEAVGSVLASSRAVLEYRAVVVGADRDELVSGLEALAEGRPAPGVVTGRSATGRTAWVFSGQGSQWAGMGRQLYDAYPEFARILDEVCARFDTLLDFSLRDALLGDEGTDVQQTGVAQPAIFAVEVALAGLLESWGVAPDSVVGHSIGEFAAAYVAGVFSLADACRLVAARGSLMQALPEGGVMLAVGAEWDRVREWAGDAAEDGVWLAAVNAPGSVVVSGERSAVEAIRARCEADGVRSSWLRVSHAFHSGLMDPMLKEFRAVAEDITYQAPSIPVVSTVSGRAESELWRTPDYWVDQVRSAVLFADAVASLRSAGVGRFIEVGPDAVLAPMVGEGFVGALMRRERESQPVQVMLALAGLYAQGAGPDWASVFAGARPAHVSLPTYAFEHEHYWPRIFGSSADVGSAGLGSLAHPLLGAVVPVAGSEAVVVSGRLSLTSHSWLADHALPGVVLFPGTGFVELAVRAGDEAGCGRLEELTLIAPLVLPERGAVDVQIVVAEPEESGPRGFEIYARDGAEGVRWVLHGTGAYGDPAADQGSGTELTAWPPADAEPVSIEGLYERLAEGGFAYGPVFQGLRAVWRRGSELFVEVALNEADKATAAGFGLHPALLDAALHAVAFTGIGADGRGRLPFAWSGVELYAVGADALRVRMTQTGPDEVSLDIADATGMPLASVESLVLRAPGVIAPQSADAGSAGRGLQEVAWEGVPVEPVTKHQRWAALGASSVGARMEGIDVPVHVESYDGLGALSGAVRSGTVLPPAVLLSCLPQDHAAEQEGESQNAALQAQGLVSDVLQVVQDWLADEQFDASRLVIVTSGAAGDEVTDPSGAAVWGLVRTAISENPGRLALVDIDADPRSWTALPAALAGGWTEAVIRDGAVGLSRLRAVDTAADLVPADGADAGWRLAVGAEATFDGMHVEQCTDLVTQALTAGQVRVCVRAAGVNFRDVLTALGMYPGPAVPLGQEGAGVVLEVGPGVADLAVGDRVFGMFPGAFGPTAIADRRLLAKAPAHWSFEQAASVPLVYLTAYYALVDLASLRSGERVLIHAAAGGVGMAAVQVARHLGAEVYGTASAGKWDTLEAMGVDGAHRASSRDLGFADTFGQVDVVLNSLAGPFVDASLGLLAEGGRFIEMGKTDVRDAGQIAADRNGVGYRAFDLFEAGEERIQEMLAELLGLFGAGTLSLSPVRSWPVARAREAFRFVSQAKHVGKVVLSVPAPWNPDGTVLITGGTGGLGADLARHLVTGRGVRNLVLTSRRGLDAPGASALADELEELGVASVRIEACDVADRAQVAELLSSMEGSPLTAIVHTAGVVDDATIGSLNAQRVGTVFGPKAEGAVHLAELTAGDEDLAAFVVFSSASGVLGGAGQGNYAAANAFLDGYAAQRSARGRGTPIHSIAWGAWHTGAGMTAGLSDADVQRMARTGLIPINREQGMALFDAALAQPRPAVTALRLDLARLRENRDGLPPILHGLAGGPGSGSQGTASRGRRTAGAAAAGGGDLAGRLAAAGPEGRAGILLDLVCGCVAAVLGFSGASAVAPDQRLSETGFDSLTAVELRNLLGKATGLRLPSTLVFDHPTAVELAGYLDTELAAAGGAEQDTQGAGAGTSGAADPAEAAEDGLTALFRTACTTGRTATGFELLAKAAELRPTFRTLGEFGRQPAAVKLTSGSTGPVVICVSSFVALAGVHQYARLAAGFRDVCDVWALSVPGFVRDEPLPADLDAVIEILASMARECADGRPFILMGSSGGGLLSHAIAEAMERAGDAPAGVVLLDTYETTEDSGLAKFEDELIGGMFDRGDLFVPMTATRLTAMSWYFGLVDGWLPRKLDRVPSLLVRATEPLFAPGPDDAAAPAAEDGWQSAWQTADDVVDVPGSHFSMMEQHCATTARAVLDWIGRARPEEAGSTAAPADTSRAGRGSGSEPTSPAEGSR